MNLIDAVYLGGLLPISPALVWRTVTDAEFRRSLPERMGWVPPARGSLWFHAASVGEVNALKPLISELRLREPELPAFVTTITPAGREAASHLPGAGVSYAPLDLSGCVRTAAGRLEPRMLVLVEQELWPNLILQSRVPIVLVNGRITERSARLYRRAGSLFRRVLRRIDCILAQTETHRRRFLQLGAIPDRVEVAGNLKFDALPPDNPNTIRGLRQRLGIPPRAPVLIGASTHPPEEEVLLNVWSALRREHPALRLILAPRHLNRLEEVSDLLRRKGVPFAGLSRRTPESREPITLVDRMGVLYSLLTSATVVFVGGTIYPRGGQNLIEPASLGKPIVTGPSLYNVRDLAQALDAAGAIRIVRDAGGVLPAVRALLSDPGTADRIGRRARDLVEAGRGAAAYAASKILDLCRARSR